MDENENKEKGRKKKNIISLTITKYHERNTASGSTHPTPFKNNSN